MGSVFKWSLLQFQLKVTFENKTWYWGKKSTLLRRNKLLVLSCTEPGWNFKDTFLGHLFFWKSFFYYYLIVCFHFLFQFYTCGWFWNVVDMLSHFSLVRFLLLIIPIEQPLKQWSIQEDTVPHSWVSYSKNKNYWTFSKNKWPQLQMWTNLSYHISM